MYLLINIGFVYKERCSLSLYPRKYSGNDGRGADGRDGNRCSENIVNITVDGNVDVDSLKVLKLKISDKAMMTPDSAACVKFVKFPRWGFDSLEALPSAANTCMRLGKPAKILLQTYQEYYWTIQVKQVIHRAIKVKIRWERLLSMNRIKRY